MASKKGFTLIDLLVSIAIISLLSAIAMASLAQAKVKAQNAVRFSNINQLQKALELYFNDKGFYPHDVNSGQGTGTWNSTVTTQSGTSNAFTDALQPLVAGGYISRIPIDPLNTLENYYQYRTQTAGELTNSTRYCGIETKAGPYILSLKSNNTISNIPEEYTYSVWDGMTRTDFFYCVTVNKY